MNIKQIKQIKFNLIKYTEDNHVNYLHFCRFSSLSRFLARFSSFFTHHLDFNRIH